MGAGVRGGPASPGLPSPSPSVSVHNRGTQRDDDAGVSLINCTAPASSHEDDDTKESDGWKLHSDESTISSRVTTPDPIFPDQLPPPFASISSRISFDDMNPFPRFHPSLRTPTQPPAALSQIGGMEWTKGWGRRHPRNQRRASRRPSSPTQVSQHSPRGLASCQVNGDQVLPSPPLLNQNSASFDGREPKDIKNPNQKRCTGRHSRALGQPTKSSSQPFLEGDQGGGNPRELPPQAATPRALAGALPLLPRPKSREKSLESPGREGSTSSESSDVDPIAYRNRWQFPPQLPAGPAYGSSVPRSRSSVTNHITAWVSRFEQSQSPERSRLGGILLALQPTDTESRRDGSGSQHSGDSSHGEIELLWQQLKVRRAKVEKIRAEMRTLRRELRDIRREKDAADNAFMSVVRPMLVPQGSGPRHTSPDLVDSKLERMQRLRDDYQVLESSYESLESKLDGEECELSILETQFFGLLATDQTTAQPRADMRCESGEAPPHAVSDIPFDLRGISRDGPTEESHPLYAELMSAIGNLENAKEEYEDLHCVKEQYELDVAAKRVAGRHDVHGMKEFLSEFPSEQQRMKEAIEQLDLRVGRLRTLCEEKKIMKKHVSIGVEYALDPRINYEDMDLDDKESILHDRHSLAHPEFHELLSQPDHLLADPEPLTPLGALKAATMLSNQNPAKGTKKRLAAKEYAIESLMRDCDGGKKADYVNRWLLHQLRTSPLHAVLLRSTFLASRSLKIRDLWRWQCDVMHYWWRDKTMALSNSFFDGHVTYNSDVEDSSRVGTPQMSRAASDGGRPKQSSLASYHRVDGCDAVTVDGCG